MPINNDSHILGKNPSQSLVWYLTRCQIWRDQRENFSASFKAKSGIEALKEP